MKYEEALKRVNAGHRIRQGRYVYFLGKKAKDTPYTLYRRAKRWGVVPGFRFMKKDKPFHAH